MSITDATKKSVNSQPFNNSKSLLNNQQNPCSNLLRVRVEIPSRIIFGEININTIKNENDILMISETEIDNSFPISQFTMTGYSIPFRFDQKSHGILLFVWEEIPCKIIKTDCDADFEGIFVEINL